MKAEVINFPYQIMYDPQLNTMFPDEYVEDFRDQMERIPENSVVYRVLAKLETESEPVHIGNLINTTKFTRSNFADRYLFFKHQDITEDYKIRPHWERGMVKNTGCPYSKQ